MIGLKKAALCCIVFAVVCITGLKLGVGNKPEAQDQLPAPTTHKNKLVPTRILQVTPADRDGYVGIMAGVDSDHLVSIALKRDQIHQGLQTEVNESVVTAYNGRNAMYIHSPGKHGTRAEVTINTLSEKFKKASITISGDLVSTGAEKERLEIVPVTLDLQGDNFKNLVAKGRS